MMCVQIINCNIRHSHLIIHSHRMFVVAVATAAISKCVECCDSHLLINCYSIVLKNEGNFNFNPIFVSTNCNHQVVEYFFILLKRLILFGRWFSWTQHKNVCWPFLDFSHCMFVFCKHLTRTNFIFDYTVCFASAKQIERDFVFCF